MRHRLPPHQPHPHAHCIVNRVDPGDGRMAVLAKDRERLSQWAHGYERERGPLLTPKRAGKYGPEAERVRRDRAQVADAPTGKCEPSQRAMLAQLDAAQRERHAKKWQALDEAYQAERKAILAQHPPAKTIAAEHHKERQAREVALQASQDGELAELDGKAAEPHLPLPDRPGRRQRGPRAGSCPAGDRLCPLAAKQRSERGALADAGKAQLAERIAETKTARELGLSNLTVRHGQHRDALISRQGAEKGKMNEVWRAAPQPERGKREKHKSRGKPARSREVEPQTPERKRPRRDREAGRGR